MDTKIVSIKSPQLMLAGIGALDRLSDEIKVMEAKKALLVTDKGVMESGIGEKIQALLTDCGAGVEAFVEVIPDPDIACAEACIKKAKSGAFDLIVGVGGGSPMDIASITGVMCNNPGTVHDYFGVNLVKNPGIPTVLIPTTAGTGAEVTPNAILTDTKEQLKKAIVSPYILPRIAVIDPLLTVTLPPRVTAFSGMDALTHAIEAYTSVNANDWTDLYATHAIVYISRSLRTATYKGENLEARYEMAIGSLYAGIALANAGVTAVHALAYPLGGEFNVPHGIANGLLLPYVMEYNVMGDIQKFAHVARLMNEPVEALHPLDQAVTAAKSVKALLEDLPVPHSLYELDIPKDAIPRMAAAAMKITRLMGNNPRNLTEDDVVEIYEQAY